MEQLDMDAILAGMAEFIDQDEKEVEDSIESLVEKIETEIIDKEVKVIEPKQRKPRTSTKKEKETVVIDSVSAEELVNTVADEALKGKELTFAPVKTLMTRDKVDEEVAKMTQSLQDWNGYEVTEEAEVVIQKLDLLTDKISEYVRDQWTPNDFRQALAVDRGELIPVVKEAVRDVVKSCWGEEAQKFIFNLNTCMTNFNVSLANQATQFKELTTAVKELAAQVEHLQMGEDAGPNYVNQDGQSFTVVPAASVEALTPVKSKAQAVALPDAVKAAIIKCLPDAPSGAPEYATKLAAALHKKNYEVEITSQSIYDYLNAIGAINSMGLLSRAQYLESYTKKMEEGK